MRYERLIARRFLQRDKSNFSRPLVNIATYTIALGVAVMVLSMCILRGFQGEITNKVVGFGSHITLRSYGWVNDYDEVPVMMDSSELHRIAELPNVAHIQAFANKGGMLKTEEQIQGIIFKGVDSGFDTDFFASNLVYGRLPRLTADETSNEIIVSQRLAAKMGLDTGSKARTYFWMNNNYRARAFQVVGIYNTDLSEFDDHYMVGDLRQVQRLNQWDNGEVAGYEVLVDDFSKLDETLLAVKRATRPDLAITSIEEEQPAMFAWLTLLNSNIVLILIIMSVVCAASVVSALLIMIFEKTSMIGLLKTLGGTNQSIRRIFLLKSAVIIGKGILLGDAIALVLSLVQNHWHLLKLDGESYSMTFVPVEINIWYFVIISLATMAVCLVALLLPSSYIAHIHPAKTVRVE